jgi:hypothetical protein
MKVILALSAIVGTFGALRSLSSTSSVSEVGNGNKLFIIALLNANVCLYLRN